VPSTGGSSATWRFLSYGLEAVNAGSTVRFVGRGTDISAAGSNKVGFNTAPGLAPGIIPAPVFRTPSAPGLATTQPVRQARNPVAPHLLFSQILSGVWG